MRRYRIGRAETNEIVVLEPTISREHAELTELGRGLFTIRDLGSTYGTAVLQGSDWSLITVAEVRHDTQVRIGEFEATVADLLRDSHPKAVRAEPRVPPWATPAPRLSDRARARHPETIHVSGPMAAWSIARNDSAPAGPQPSDIAPRGRPMRESQRKILPLLAGIGAILTVGLITLGWALVR